jgi:hypothetical protein
LAEKTARRYAAESSQRTYFAAFPSISRFLAVFLFVDHVGVGSELSSEPDAKRFESFYRECAAPFNDQSLVQREHFHQPHERGFRQAARAEITGWYQEFFRIQRRRNLRSDGEQHRVIVRGVEGVGRNNEAGTLLCGGQAVKGNGTRTMSPRLKGVVDGIFGVVPEVEGAFGEFHPRGVVLRNFEVARQFLEQLNLLAHVESFDGSGDGLDGAHDGILLRCALRNFKLCQHHSCLGLKM